jgi:hypothetical protein
VELDRATQIYTPAIRAFNLLGAARDFRIQHAASATEISESYRKHFPR